MPTKPPLSLDPSPIFASSTVQHVVLTERARHVPGQAIGAVLLQTDHLRQLLLGVAAGKAMPRHEATCDVTVTVVAGVGTLTLDGAEPICLRPGVHLFLPAGAPHAVEAEEDLTFVATFMDPAPEIHFLPGERVEDAFLPVHT